MSNYKEGFFLRVKSLALNAIGCLIERKCPVGNCCVPLQYIHKGMEESELPGLIAGLLECVEDNYYVQLLQLTTVITNKSQVACKKMIAENIINHILRRLSPCGTDFDTNDECCLEYSKSHLKNYDGTGQILWNLLKVYKNSNNEFRRCFKGPDQRALKSFRCTFKYLICSKINKFERNDYMGILLFMLELFPNMKLGNTGIIDGIVK